MKKIANIPVMLLAFLVLVACGGQTETVVASQPTPTTTPTSTWQPEAPANFTVSLDKNNDVVLEWEPSPSNPADPESTTYYAVKRKILGGDFARLDTISSTSYLDIGLPAGTYVYFLEAYATGWPRVMATPEISILSPGSKTKPPIPPGNGGGKQGRTL